MFIVDRQVITVGTLTTLVDNLPCCHAYFMLLLVILVANKIIMMMIHFHVFLELLFVVSIEIPVSFALFRKWRMVSCNG